MPRKAEYTRKTNETNIAVAVCIDGKGISNIRTGIGFLDHMLELLARHGLFDLEVKADGDLRVDAHHTAEDIGIVLGTALKEALGDKVSIKRYGTSFVPMDETLAMVSIDLSGRPYLVYRGGILAAGISSEGFDFALVEEFFRAVAFNSGMTLHMEVLYGSNLHHVAEALFKAFARALREASGIDAAIQGVLSTKGVL
ncbi:MAG: imidazoleglycerol-phosphate dehydratase HisB [Eubacteriales bacterium]|nr:imidazoleglycerol-phosphate dehydratase HisB [Eubacteriales bacterium]